MERRRKSGIIPLARSSVVGKKRKKRRSVIKEENGKGNKKKWCGEVRILLRRW